MSQPNRLAKNLVTAALDFHRRRPWKRVPPDCPFIVRVPNEDHPLVGFVIGQEGGEFGVAILRGENAFEHAVEWCDRGSGMDPADRAEVLAVTFEPYSAIPQELRTTLDEARFQGRRENVAPTIFSKRQHERPKPPSKGEMRTLLWALRGIAAAEDQGHLRPWGLESSRGRILEIVVEGQQARPTVTSRAVPHPAAPSRSGDWISPHAISLPGELSLLPRLDERWVAGAPILPGRVEGTDGIPRTLVVCVEGRDEICCSRVFCGGDLGAAAEALTGAMRGDGDRRAPGLPREIVFESTWLQEAFAPALSLLGISTRVDEDHEGLLSVHRAMAEVDADLARRTLERPEGLIEWKAVDAEVCSLICDAALESGPDSQRSRARYFGSAEAAESVFEEFARLSPLQAFGDWLAADYRRTPRSRTFLEGMLREGKLRPAFRQVVEAHITAELSIYRVNGTDPGATVSVEDVLTGKEHVIHDKSLSGADIEGWFLPLRLRRVGEWTFPSVAGPVLGFMEIDQALHLLERKGVELTPQGMRQKAHLVGRLWVHHLERRRHPPKMHNTDGDPIELYTATFRVAEPNAVAQALNARADVAQDEDPGSWMWFKEGGPARPALGLGSVTTLGHIELLGDRLVLEVNSARRLALAREWIESLPGTVFERATVRDMAGDGRAPDDTLQDARPPRMEAPMQAALKQEFRKLCLDWLDRPVPALDGRTPRQAVRDDAMRNKVVRMIRTMPPALVPGGRTDVPRKEMLADLGLSGT